MICLVVDSVYIWVCLLCVCVVLCYILTAVCAVSFGDTFGDWAHVAGRSVCVSWTGVNFCVWTYFVCQGDILARRESRLYLVSIIEVLFCFLYFRVHVSCLFLVFCYFLLFMFFKVKWFNCVGFLIKSRVSGCCCVFLEWFACARICVICFMIISCCWVVFFCVQRLFVTVGRSPFFFGLLTWMRGR